jgi:hypothetical protein
LKELLERIVHKTVYAQSESLTLVVSPSARQSGEFDWGANKMYAMRVSGDDGIGSSTYS